MKTPVLTGAQVWHKDRFSHLSGLRIGFVGNHTAMITDGLSTLAALVDAPNVKVGALFGPEHGAFGTFDDNVPDLVEPLTGLPIYSLYGEHKKPTPERMAGLDALVFELQDIGARFYTYASTLGLCLEACVDACIPMIVLDRPNPITGTRFEGPLADEDRLSFTAFHRIPVRHGVTLGELARLYAYEKGFGEVVWVAPCEGWDRSQWFDETGVAWRNPSPAMRTLTAATLYPGVCLLEQTNFSVGRGTEAPFEIIGAPYVDSGSWLSALADMDIPGVAFAAASFTPTLRDFVGERCEGIRISIIDRDVVDAVRLGVALAVTLIATQPAFEPQGILNLLANKRAHDLLLGGADTDTVCASWSDDLAAWESRRRQALLY
jgi:uncharacterized protein YbbC (DUF1343 family)